MAKTSEDYARYETAARGMATSAESDSERAYFEDRAGLHRARKLGTDHGRDGNAPYGDLDDAGSGDLMDALGETGATTDENYPRRLAMLDAYREAWEQAAGRFYPVGGDSRRSCSCGNAWADEPGHDFDLDDVSDEDELTWADRCTAEDPCPTRAAQGGMSCNH